MKIEDVKKIVEFTISEIELRKNVFLGREEKQKIANKVIELLSYKEWSEQDHHMLKE